MAGAIKAKVDELTAPINDMNKSIFGIAAASPTKRSKNKCWIIFKIVLKITEHQEMH